MFDRLEAALGEAEQAMADLDPDALVGTQPSVGVDLLVRHERVTAAARLAIVARAERMHPWSREGYRSFEDWLAAREGTSAGKARRRARTAKKLADRDRTADALADGEISEDEAEVIADAADQNPDAEQDLVDTAKNRGKSHDDLKKRAADAKAAGEDDRARAERHRRGRRARWGLDREGFWTLSGRFQPEVGAELKAALIAETDRVFARARAAGTREPSDRYRADALAALLLGRHPATTGPATSHTEVDDDNAASRHGEDQLGLDLSVTGDGTGSPDTAPPAASAGSAGSGPVSRVGRVGREMVLIVDLAALRRGCVNPGETCVIRGVGPVPVEVARAWAHDAFVKAVIADGTDIRTVAHLGRHIPAPLRTALDLVDTTCAVPGCGDPRIEYDHHQPHAHGGPCSVTNLRPLCRRHHRQRTHHGYQLEGQPGDRRWLDPHGTVLFADQPHHLTTNHQRAP